MSNAPTQPRYLLFRVEDSDAVPAIGDAVEVNHLTGVGDAHDDLRLARDQAAVIQDDEPSGNKVIICDTTTGRRVE